ncbi:MAG: TonB-dependent receptor [Rikenellaceae bacterium]|nr:TonB-dependent receptor [Rikenellaceae bacterium]
MKHLLLTCMMSIMALVGYAQRGTITAAVFDAETKETVIGAVVAVAPADNPEKAQHTTTGYGGKFTTAALPYGEYQLTISFMGYNNHEATIKVDKPKIDLGQIELKPGVAIESVVKEVKAIRASQKGDTISYNASAFKVTNDADVEGLLKKMPGITVTDGKVETQGEEVKKIFVDGKEFFGEDVTTAIKSLPAETVDRIEVYNKLSDAAEFSGMDDGEGYKALNIVTRSNMRQGQFGKVYAGVGYDAEDGAEDRFKYLAGGNVNLFNGSSRLSVLALFNNVNQQNFSFEDILGVSGGGGGRRGGVGAYMMRPQSGIAKVNAIGLNYSNQWGKKDQVTFQGSYFFNNTNTDNRTTVEKWYEAPMLPDTLLTRGESETAAYNHRFNARIEWKINENHNLMIRPSFSFQSNNPLSNTYGWQFGAPEEGGGGYSYTDNFNEADRKGYNLNTRVVYRAKLGKDGRTLTVNGNVRYGDRDNKSSSWSNQLGTLQDRPEGGDVWNWNAGPYSDLRYLRNIFPTTSFDMQGEITYTEPVAKYAQVSLQYRADYQSDTNDRSTYITGEDFSIAGLLPDPALSSNFERSNMEHRVGPGFRYSKNRNTFVANVYYQASRLEGEVLSGQVVGDNRPIKHDYNNFTYFMMGQLQPNQQNSLRLFVRSNTGTPNIENLQNIFDVSNAQNISRGNPYLKPSYNHNINFHYTHSSLEKGRTFMWMFSWNKTQNMTATHLVQSTRENPIEISLTDSEGTTTTYTPNYFSQPVNLDGQWSLMTMLMYGTPISFLKSNFNMMGGVNYSKTPSMVGGMVSTDGVISGGEKNNAENMGYFFRAVLGSNISENVDFTLSWNGNYNEATNSLAAAGAKNKYFSHTANAAMKFILPWDITFTANAAYSQYLGITNDYNEDYLICNIYLGKKIFKNKRGEILIGVNDLLNENSVAFSRSTGSGYTQNTTNLSMGRYYMLQFTYNLRLFGKKGSRNMSDYESSGQQEFRQHRRMMGPPPGGGGGFGPR